MMAVRMPILLAAAVCAASCGTTDQASSDAILARALTAVYPHWVLQCDDPGFANATATFIVMIDGRGRIVGEPEPVAPEDTPGYRAVAVSALTALRAAEPYPVPAGFEGGAIQPKFNPTRACASSN